MDYKKVVKTANDNIGYQGEYKNSKFTEFLDSINWYNGKKAGACTWCGEFYDYCIAVNKEDLTYGEAQAFLQDARFQERFAAMLTSDLTLDTILAKLEEYNESNKN